MVKKEGNEDLIESQERNMISDVYYAVDDSIDHVVEEAKRRSRAFRRAWVPVIKSLLSSGSDLVGDWYFYYRTKNGENILDEFERPLWIFCVIASVFGGLAMISTIMNNFPCFAKNESLYKKKCLKRINYLLGLEMFLEDIPQMILTTMVALRKRGGVWTPVSIFNLTTSAFNFTFNILDMLMPLPEETIEAAKAAKKA